MSSLPQARQELLQTLREKIGRIERSDPAPLAPHPSSLSPLSSPLPSPFSPLFPDGWRRGRLIEWLAVEEWAPAATLALAAAREACHERGPLVVVDRRGEFYPPAAAGLGIDPARIVVVRPGSVADGLWALDQALRCRGVGGVLGWVETLDGRTFRRLQLAAETGEGLGLLIRPPAARREPSWADLRLAVESRPSPAGRRLLVEVVRRRGGKSDQSLELEIDDETGVPKIVPPPAQRKVLRWAN